MRITDFISSKNLYIDKDQAQRDSLKALKKYRDGINKSEQLDTLFRLHCLLLPKAAISCKMSLDEIAGYFWEALIYSADRYDLDMDTNMRFGSFVGRKLKWIIADYYSPLSQNIVKVPRKYMRDIRHEYVPLDWEDREIPENSYRLEDVILESIDLQAEDIWECV